MSAGETKLHVRWPHTFYSPCIIGISTITKHFHGRLRKGPKAWHYSLDTMTTTATPETPTMKQNKLPICDRDSQYNVQGKGKRQFFVTECHLNGREWKRKEYDKCIHSLSLGGYNMSNFLFRFKKTN